MNHEAQTNKFNIKINEAPKSDPINESHRRHV